MTIQSFSASIAGAQTGYASVGHMTQYRRGDPNAAIVATAAAIATLVADGASPTQAHVTVLAAAAAPLTGATADDVTLLFNAANITSRTWLRQALDQLIKRVYGANLLTP